MSSPLFLMLYVSRCLPSLCAFTDVFVDTPIMALLQLRIAAGMLVME